MQDVIGWDIGGAHVKAARAHEGRIVAVVQRACAPHTGLASLEEAVRATSAELGPAARHHVTMTAELSDAFEDRARGVVSIAAIMTHALGAETFFYAGAQGLIARASAANSVREIASANWRASAELAARCCRDALFIDIGSTTADLIPICDHVIVAGGVTDAERLALGELAYAGFSRGAPQAYARQAPIGGRWTPLVNEAFASMADVRRALGELSDGDSRADLAPTADGRPKTPLAAQTRLARLAGCDAGDLGEQQLRVFADYLARAQLRVIEDQIALLASRDGFAPDAAFVGAGVGRGLVARLAQAHGRAVHDFADFVPASEALRAAAADCAPAVALALLR
jgi:(4-(4-[2-(gamma-L-glutamylamino)ethyl]phenoxymethyl)furan-2-yl)methanamine synthase